MDEWYNPFTASDGFAPHAPAGHPGAMLFKSVFFTVAEGITDATYWCTLEQALAMAGSDPQKAAAVSAGRALVAEILQAIPFLPGVQGLGSPAEGALVGQGLQTPAAARCSEWRHRIALALVDLQR